MFRLPEPRAIRGRLICGLCRLFLFPQLGACSLPAQLAASPGLPVEPLHILVSAPARAMPANSWIRLRDAGVIRQTLAVSCGAASLATIMNGHYGMETTELQLIVAMRQDTGFVSFAEMAQILPTFGLRGRGFSATWDQLARVRMPVVVHMRVRGEEHFAVLRGISHESIWLADPAAGNVTYSREQFLPLWVVHAETGEGVAGQGRFLAVLPGTRESVPSEDFFTAAPRRSSAGAVSQVAFGRRGSLR
jgi:predicted double-glycine peptidase